VSVTLFTNVVGSIWGVSIVDDKNQDQIQQALKQPNKSSNTDSVILYACLNKQQLPLKCAQLLSHLISVRRGLIGLNSPR